MSKRVERQQNDVDAIRLAVKEWWMHNTRETLIKDKNYHPDEVDTLEEATNWILRDDPSQWECSLEEMRDEWGWSALE